MVDSVIRTEHLSRFFGSVKAVDDLSLDVPAGIVFGFLGPNGAGNSQFLLLVMAAIAVLDAILLGLSLVSFQRSRLILS
jgi:ABC-type multidrug transport system ATPase subunit